MMTNSMPLHIDTGAVVIGRNEGEQLRACLRSVKRKLQHVVYVDSGSTDDSIDIAIESGVEVVRLDLSTPFTAARARNLGFSRLNESMPDVDFIQFIDGDCELAPEWLETAVAFLKHNDNVGVACGRRRERYPEATVYNWLCDIEWNTRIGETRACGGDALMRKTAFTESGGFRDGLIAGEEPELCLRLRQKHWRIWRLDEEMTLHDARIMRFKQWWTRATRAGHAFAEGAWIHAAGHEKHWAKETLRAIIWGIGIPIFGFILGLIDPRFFLVFLLYPIQLIRLMIRGKKMSMRQRFFHACFLLLGKFAEAAGILKFLFGRLRGKTHGIIEYK